LVSPQRSYNFRVTLRFLSVQYGDAKVLTPAVKQYVEKCVDLCQPERVHICDGSEGESQLLQGLMLKQGTIVPLPKYENCWLARTNPADVARVEGKTFAIQGSELAKPRY